MRGEWYPALKMQWVEGGLRLNEFVGQYLGKPNMLKALLRLWVKTAGRLRSERMAHADLQHGNVLLVPRPGKTTLLRLIDYDGMYVPSLAGTPAAELGHPAFQHPQRARKGIYSAEVDRFSHLVIYTSIHCLTVGGQGLWERFNNGDNLLFRESDFLAPAKSKVFRTLWNLPDAEARSLVGRLALSCKQPLAQAPLLEDIANGSVLPLTQAEEQAAGSILGSGTAIPPVVMAEPILPPPSTLVPQDLLGEELPPVDPLSPALRRPRLNPKRSNRIDFSPLALLQRADRVLKELAGKENGALHNFLRVLPFMALLFIFSIVWLMRSPDQDRTVAETQQETETSLASADPVPVEPIPEATSNADPAPAPAPDEPIPEATPKTAISPDPAADLTGLITNSIGMQFKLIPAGELMGRPEDDPEKQPAETPQHLVQITQPFYLGIHEVTQEQYEKVTGKNPSHFKGATLPVEEVSWEDARQFCKKLSEMDADHNYRLPTEAQWEYACRAGTTTRYSCGNELDSDCAWFRGNSGNQSHPVGEKRPNAWGLYDMHGNVWEWCSDGHDIDCYGDYPAVAPTGPSTGSVRVVRGGSCVDAARYCRSADRRGYWSGDRSGCLGFRVALVPAESVPVSEDTMSPPEPEPEPSLTPATPEPAAELPEDHTNAIGMQFKLIPAGEFMMGSPANDPDKSDDETPQHRVRITKPFYLSVCEVTQGEFEQVMEWNPSQFKGTTRPVEGVSWRLATEFCEKLSELDDRYDYRLPTEAEWEYACRAGTTTRFSCGDELGPEYAWFNQNSGLKSQPVEQKLPNAWGLYDMHGNVQEWCQDRYDTEYYDNSPTVDPMGAERGHGDRVIRGGGMLGGAKNCRSADRRGGDTHSDKSRIGFRVVSVLGRAQNHTNNIGMKFKLIPAGEFMMGSPDDDSGKTDYETPQHLVRITKPFYLGIHEVTQEQYEKVMDKNPSKFKGSSLPVEQVSWEDVTEFCKKLSEMDEEYDYRLPTEAEWEYACRAGTTTIYSCGDKWDPSYAWFDSNSSGKTHPVGLKQPNAWGLHDMHGNVFEWCQDWYDGAYYKSSPSDDPAGPATGSGRVLRGGGWNGAAGRCRSAFRYRFAPVNHGIDLGFRVAQVPAE